MSSQAAKYPTAFVKKDQEVLADKTFDFKVVPRWEADDPIIDPKYVGKLKGRPTKVELQAKTSLKKLIVEYGTEINPVTGLERSLTVLIKLEELALQGDVDAAKEFLNRTVGKPEEKLSVSASTPLEDLSDEEVDEALKEEFGSVNPLSLHAESIEVFPS